MANQANNNGANKSWFKYFLEDLCKKLYREDLFRFETFPTSINKIKKPLDKLTKNEKDFLVNSVQDIGYYNNEYALLGTEFITLYSQKNDLLNRHFYKDYIERAKNGYLKKKIIALFVLKYLMILAQLYLTYYFIYPRHRCIYEHIADENENFWYCGREKCKVKEIDKFKDKIFMLRIIFFIYNIISFMIQIYVVINLERIKSNKVCVIIFQVIKYIIIGPIIYYDIFKGNYCEISKNDKNIFYVKNDVLEKFELILDIINIYIN